MPGGVCVTTDLVTANLGLVGAAIKQSGVKLDGLYGWDDAFQDGAVELVKCAERYDPGSMGFAFTTYSFRRVRTAVERGRGRFEGRSFRRAALDGERFVPPVSVEDLLFQGDDGREPFDWPDGTSVEETVSSRVDVESFVDGLARSDADRRLLEAVASGTSLPEHAVAEGVSRQAVYQRWGRLTDRAKSFVGCGI